MIVMVDCCKKDKITGKLKLPIINILYYSVFETFKHNNSDNIKVNYVNKQSLSSDMKQKTINAFLRSYGGNENYDNANSILSIKKQLQKK